MTAPDPSTEHVCTTETGVTFDGAFWQCTAHAMGNFGCATVADAEDQAADHREAYRGIPG